jgi:hypothetical protein
MRRHGWAFCLGLFLTGAATAQPPADEDRFPPPPDLPGEVISQLPGPKAVDATPPKDGRPAPLPDLQPVPYTGTVSAAVAPVEPPPAAVPPVLGMVAPAAPCPPAAPACRPSCGIGFGDIQEWLLFRSQSRQSGHFVTPYHPPLYAWFPCEPGKGPCCVGGFPAKPGCAVGAAGTPVTVTTPAVAQGGLPVPNPEVPVAPELPLGGGAPIGKCAEPLTTFEPVGAGLGFTPGRAPMANPTTQIKPSSWRPR